MDTLHWNNLELVQWKPTLPTVMPSCRVVVKILNRRRVLVLGFFELTGKKYHEQMIKITGY